MISIQSEQVWKDLALLLLRRFGIVLPLLVVSIFGPVYSHSLPFVDGVILSRYCFVSPYYLFGCQWVGLVGRQLGGEEGTDSYIYVFRGQWLAGHGL